MQRIIKLSLALMLCAVLSLGLVSKVRAQDLFNSETIKSYTEIETSDVHGVATINTTTLKTYNDRIIDSKKLSDHRTSWIEPTMSIKESDLRVVNYTSGTPLVWNGKKPTELAAVYERENPGWIVVGGVNGDFFHISDNDEVLGTSMQEGDFYKPYDYNNQGHQALGFKDDGSYVSGIVEKSAYEYVQVLGADDTYQDVAEILSIDATPSASGVSLLTRFDAQINKSPHVNLEINGVDLPYDLSEYTVYTIDAKVQRYDRNSSSSGSHKVFVKGVITAINTNQTTYQMNDSDHTAYLVCKDNSLEQLQIGDEVRCQYKTTGKWADVTNITGAYNQILKNGEVVDYTGVTDVNTGYVNCVKNRTIMGFKADGTPIMMVVEKSGVFGASYEECGEILKSLGCVEGFLFDGGGSSCIFIRDELGRFQTINYHEDGRTQANPTGEERADGNAVLLVMRDPGCKLSVNTIDYFSASFDLLITNEEYFSELSDIKITVNGVTKPYQKGGVEFTGLCENTEYQVELSYKLNKTEKINKLVSSVKTSKLLTKDFTDKDVKVELTNITDTAFTFEKNPASKALDVIVHIGNKTYAFGDKDSIVCGELQKDNEYDVYFEYQLLDDKTNTKYSFTTEKVKYRTASYTVPAIELYEESIKTKTLIGIKYKYADPDSKVTKAYIEYGTEKFEITSKTGTATIQNLDFENNSYEFKLVLEYEDEAGNVQKVESEVLKYIIEVEEPDPTPEKKKCGSKCAELIIASIAVTSSLGLVFRKRK